MQHRPLKRRRSTSSINDHDNPSLKRQKLLASVFKQLQQTAEEVRCALNSSNWLSVEERVRAALIIDHVEMMSRMMDEGYEFGDGEGDEEMEEDEYDGEEYEDADGDRDGNEDNAGGVVGEVAVDEPDTPLVEGVTESLGENDEKEGSGGEEGGDGDGDSDGEKEDEDSYSSWMKRGVSFSAGVTCTACTESEGS